MVDELLCNGWVSHLCADILRGQQCHLVGLWDPTCCQWLDNDRRRQACFLQPCPQCSRCLWLLELHSRTTSFSSPHFKGCGTTYATVRFLDVSELSFPRSHGRSNRDIDWLDTVAPLVGLHRHIDMHACNVPEVQRGLLGAAM